MNGAGPVTPREVAPPSPTAPTTAQPVALAPSANLPLKPVGGARKIGQAAIAGAHSKVGVWIVILGLVVALVVVTVGFLYLEWPPRYIPLYEADAEVAIVAAALYAVVVEWGPKHSPNV